MAFIFTDHVHTKSFTPREHQVELLYSALERNIIICLGKTPELTFIATKLIQEFAIDNRKSVQYNGKRIVYLLEDDEACAAKAVHIEQSTDLRALLCKDEAEFDRDKLQSDAQVLVLTMEMCNKLLASWSAMLSCVSLLLIDKCHNLATKSQLENVLDAFRSCSHSPRIVGFAVPLYSLTKVPGLLSYEIEKIESSMKCQIETASDLLSILRYSPQPREYLIAYKVSGKGDATHLLRNCAKDALDFMCDHRYDPSEIYDDEFIEEIKKIPDPTVKPRQMIEEFLYVLDTLGPWAADRAAFVMLTLVEKLKIKTPYDRHYLLLGILTTLFVKIRAFCDTIFEELGESEKMVKFSSPKIKRVIEVIKIFTPPEKSENEQNGVDKIEIKGTKEENNNDKLNIKNQFKRPDPDNKRGKYYRQRGPTDPDLLCGLIFVESVLTAKVLYHLISGLSKHEEEFRFLSPLYMSEKTNDEVISGKDIELEHRKQEEVLKRFRIHECNLLISTSVLEEGIDIPKCNFVMRFDFPKTYQSYLQCKSRARAPDAMHILLVSETNSEECMKELSHYHYIEKIFLAKCSSKDASPDEESEADDYDSILPVYKPLPEDDAPKVTLNSAISLVNRYCAKLPSDTFTRLTPEWKFHSVTENSMQLYKCSLRLPINSPLKYTITSYPMPNKALAKRMAALQMCVQLHRENEIDDFLLPVGKENFIAHPEDSEVPPLPDDENISPVEARPGTTKRRQYYYKKIADSLIDCKPEMSEPCYLYHIRMVLSCPLPEEQNTRGRKLYPPEESAIGFGILTYKKIPKLCPFPIYTRSGEVKVELKLCKETVVLDDLQIEKAVSFLKYTFTNVLRLQKCMMAFDSKVSENSYIIVPVKRPIAPDLDISVDWDFVECIYKNDNVAPTRPLEESRSNFAFDPSKYTDAVVMPWYRNQDQPQYFYVAEICNHLNPRSEFPGSEYETFEEYYLKKYDIQIQNLEQPLLDVDHTSARLNFLTPRYVNRKGVALPTSSEETKRAKRENLEQKQILVAELCAVHPFPASLWRQAVCLPCILYRINALLLADQIRLEVARTISLGQESLPEEFEWPPLDFGWSLADVLRRSRDNERTRLESKEAKEVKENEEDNADQESSQDEGDMNKRYKKQKLKITEITDGEEESESVQVEEEEEEEEEQEEEEEEDQDKLVIDTWTNDMLGELGDSQVKGFNENYNDNRNYKASPTFDSNGDGQSYASDSSDYDDFDDCYDDYDRESSEEEDQEKKNLTIAYNNDNEAEAFDKKGKSFEKEKKLDIDAQDKLNDLGWDVLFNADETLKFNQHKAAHEENVKSNEKLIVRQKMFVEADEPVTFGRKSSKAASTAELKLKHEVYVSQVSKEFQERLKGPNLLKNVQVAAIVPETSIVKDENKFSFDHQPELEGHPGPSPSLILQALTMSNANDGINLERLETIGDSFLKYAITTYLFCTYNNIHEGKLSHLRSKQVSNLNLYRLGRRKCLGESMIATKFEPHDNWLPPCYTVPKELERALVRSGIPSAMWPKTELTNCRDKSEIERKIRETEEELRLMRSELELQQQQQQQQQQQNQNDELQQLRTFIPYNLITQHSIPDKSIADCVEALIGAYLIACGPRGALLFMSWLGIHVLPTEEKTIELSEEGEEPRYRKAGSTPYVQVEGEEGKWKQLLYGSLMEPLSPLFYNIESAEENLEVMLDGYDALEESIGYKFVNRSYLLQAFTHASYQSNRLTDCYQRLEFLGDAVLDYLITRHLYEDPRQHSPGALTDLRSALVNNTIFASLAARCGFHKYFRHLSPGLNSVIDRFVRIQEENGHSISEEYYLIGEDDEDAAEEAEDVEVPKALGDVFESLAGAIYLDSNMSLDAVWNVYYKIMRSEIEQFSSNVPKSPIRELLELEPETAKFGRPEKLADGKRVRVTVVVFGKGSFKGIGRNYRIAKCTAAKCALKKLKKARKLGV